MQHYFDGLACLCQFNALIDLIQRKDMGNELIRRENGGAGQLEGSL